MNLTTIIIALIIMASAGSAHANGCHFLDLYAFIKGYRIGDVLHNKPQQNQLRLKMS